MSTKLQLFFFLFFHLTVWEIVVWKIITIGNPSSIPPKYQSLNRIAVGYTKPFLLWPYILKFKKSVYVCGKKNKCIWMSRRKVLILMSYKTDSLKFEENYLTFIFLYVKWVFQFPANEKNYIIKESQFKNSNILI